MRNETLSTGYQKSRFLIDLAHLQMLVRSEQSPDPFPQKSKVEVSSEYSEFVKSQISLKNYKKSKFDT